MSEAELTAPRPVRAGVAVAVVLLHLLVVAGLVQAFAPDVALSVARRTLASLTLDIEPPAPSPKPTPPPTPAAARATAASGAQGAAGRRAIPREVKAPPPRIALATATPAPAATATGNADSSGARAAGSGTGAGGAGAGTGSGGAGDGQGAGGGTRLVKIAGDINSARDYPAASRDQRIGDHVRVWLTVGPDGRVAACRIVRPSRDAQADAITCRLAQQRFRFRSATDANGRPVSATFEWTQRWFYKD